MNKTFFPLKFRLNSTYSLEALQRQMSHRHKGVPNLTGWDSLISYFFVIEKKVIHSHTVTMQHK